MKKINDIEKQVLIFRKVSYEDEEYDKQYPIKLPDESYRTNTARNYRRKMDFAPPPKYQKPKRRIFPPPKIEKTQDLSSTGPLIPLTKKSNITTANYDASQIDLKKERDKLTQKTLYLDRLISIEKLKLKLFHDHRTLAELKNELDILQSEHIDTQGFNHKQEEENENNEFDENDNQNYEEEYFDEDQEGSESLKNSIELIKERIQSEKKMISFYESQYYPIHAAAIDIQRIWRGFLIRKSKKDQKEPENDQNENPNDQPNNDQIQNTNKEEEEDIPPNKENFSEKVENEEDLNEKVENEQNLNEKVKSEQNLNEKVENEEDLNEKVENEQNLNEKVESEQNLNEKVENEEDLNEKVESEQNLNEKVESEQNLNEKAENEEDLNVNEEKVN